MSNMPQPSKDKPANANQLAVIRVLCKRLDVENQSNESWSSFDASKEINRLSTLYNNCLIRGPKD